MKIKAAVLVLALTAATAAAQESVALSWILSTSPNPMYQNVYRQNNCAGKWVKKAKLLASDTTWTDALVKDGKTYCYYVTVTVKDEKGAKEMSDPSDIATATIP